MIKELNKKVYLFSKKEVCLSESTYLLRESLKCKNGCRRFARPECNNTFDDLSDARSHIEAEHLGECNWKTFSESYTAKMPYYII